MKSRERGASTTRTQHTTPPNTIISQTSQDRLQVQDETIDAYITNQQPPTPTPTSPRVAALQRGTALDFIFYFIC